MKKLLVFVLLVLPMAGFGEVSRLITVQTPYVDTAYAFRIGVLSFKPLDLQFNHSFGKLVDISAETILPLWFFSGYNFGAKVAFHVPVVPLTIGASCNVLVFRGEKQVLDLIGEIGEMPISINSISINFSSTKLDVGLGLDLKILRVYAVADMMFYGNTNGSSSYIHPTVGADLGLGKAISIFAEFGYYFTTEGNPIDTIDGAGAYSPVLPSDFTAGLGVEFDLKIFNARLGVQYPGMQISYPDTTGAMQELNLPVVPYVDLGFQF